MQRLETFYHDARRPRIRPIIGTFTRPTSGSRRRHLTLRKSARDWLRFKKFRSLTNLTIEDTIRVDIRKGKEKPCL